MRCLLILTDVKLSPESHGLSTIKLEQAGKRLEEALAAGRNERYCFLLVKDGVLVHEQYYGSHSADEKHTVFSVGKTWASALVGVAVSKGLLDIDRPIVEYGVDVSDFGVYGSKVTTRAILGQASGEGKHEPGSKYIYDSGRWINTISTVLDKVTGGVGVGKWGTEHMTELLGAPGFWANQQDNIAVGGGQSATCRELARMGQLLLNRGKWVVGGSSSSGNNATAAAAAASKPRRIEQLISADYVSQMTSPAFPDANYAQGFLTWLNLPAHSPVYWERSVCPDLRSEGYPIGNPRNKGASVGASSNDVSMMGYLGQYVIVMPDTGEVAVTMGNTMFGWDRCPDYDSHLILTNFFEAISDALVPEDRAASGGMLRGGAALL